MMSSFVEGVTAMVDLPKWSGNYKTARLLDVTTSTLAGNRALTPKGIATRNRIVAVAAELILEHGMESTRLEEIQGAAHVSASQLYHYFTDKNALILAVIEHQTELVLGGQRAMLERLDSFAALEEWREEIVVSIESMHCVGGCPLGSLAGSLAESDPIARAALADSFARWQELLESGLELMRERGELRSDIDANALALGILASVQGGLLLSQTRRDSTAVRIALDLSIAYLRTLRP
jgi:TetR/AcrR family transcriptional regulator, transcriptional repressor for nem operon